MSTLDNNDRLSVKTTIDGLKLARSRRRFSQTLRAVLADELTTGEQAVRNLTKRQAAAIAGVRMADIRAARKARTSSPADYEAMRADRTDVTAVRRRQLASRPISDAKLERTIVGAGLGRALAALDRLTAPPNGAAATANGHTATAGNSSATTAPAQPL